MLLMMSCPLLAGKSVHAPGHLSGGGHSEWDARVATLVTHLHYKGENGSPQAHTVTLIIVILQLHLY